MKSLGDRRARAWPRGAAAVVVAVVALIWNGDSFPDNVAPANAVALSQPLNRRHGVGAFAGVVATQQAQEFYEPVCQLRLGKPGGAMPSALSVHAATILRDCELGMAASMPLKRRNSGRSMAVTSCTCNAISAPTA